MTKVLCQIEESIATITLNYPEKHNILNPETIALLSDAYQRCNDDNSVRLIVLLANGKHFCAGADLTHMLAMGRAPLEENINDAKRLAELFYLIYTCKKPTIACIHGSIRGGGLGLCATNDIVIAETNTTFAFTEVKLGLWPAVISPYVLQRMSHQSAKYQMMTADVFNANAAAQMQLVDHICDKNDMEKVLKKISGTLVTHPPIALEKTKQWLQALQPITAAEINESAKQLAVARSGEVFQAHFSTH